MELLIVGAGAMGRWFAETVDAAVAFADADAAVAEAAAAAHGGRAVSPESDDTFDVVCLAVPMFAVADEVLRHAPRAERAMIDVSGSMAAPVRAMRTHLPDRERVSLHPLFAPANAPGNVAVVADNPGPATDRIRDDVAAAGNRLFETTVAEHDEAMESVQSAAHAAVLAYALAVDDVRAEFATPVSAALDEAAAMVTEGTPRVYREIQETFPGADRVAAAAKRIADAEGAAFDDIYREAAAGRTPDRPPERDGTRGRR